MNVAQVTIHQQPGLISIHSEAATLTITQRRAKTDMHAEPVLVGISRAEGGLSIDQTKAWAALGLMPARELRQTIYSQVENIALQAIAKYVQEGNRLAAIHQPGDALVDLAKQAAQTDLAKIHYTGPARYDNVDVHYVPDKLSISFSGGEVHYRAEPQQPLTEWRPGQVQIGMKQYPAIRFEVSGNHVDRVL